MKTIFILIVSAAAYLLSASVSAQTLRNFDLPTETKVSLNHTYYDNFFQDPDGEPHENVNATTLELDIISKLRDGLGWRYYGRGGITAYSDNLDETARITGGARYLNKPHELDIGLTYERQGLNFDVGDRFNNSDNFELFSKYEYRLNPRWKLAALGELKREEVSAGAPDNSSYRFGGQLKYRGWGYEFMPSIGLAYGDRDSDDPNDDRDQKEAFIQFESSPTDKFYISARYRYRNRDYPVSDPTRGNFNRDDDRHQITVSSEYRFTKRFSINLYYDYLDNRSTRDGRSFTSNELTLGLLVYF